MMVRHRAVLALAALALAGGSTWALVNGTGKVGAALSVKLPIELGGVRVSELSPGYRPNRKTVAAGPRDWLVETDRLKFTFGADSSSLEGRGRLGALLDLGSKSLEDDELRELRTVLSIGGHNVSLQVAEVTVVEEDGQPIVRIRQLSHDGRLELETDYATRRGSDSITITTQVLNVTDRLMRSVQVGDRVLWPGLPTFAPRAGFVRLASHAEVPWVAREGQRSSYVLSFGGALFDSSFLFDRIGPLGQVTLSPAHDVPPGASVEVERQLFAARGGLDSVGELAWKSIGKSVGFVKGTLSPPPSWGIVEARYPDNKPALSVRADSEGNYRLPLPDGEYRLILRSPGGEDQEDISIDAEGPAYDANLLPPRPGTLR
ncbi:MAG TPA: carboxypeptidase-like regulatory domain-containing protein, partial [Polyangiaceae bacterium]|nr:carboxypeptidase-like regulatory domain-containing protein [Polyangiaceae bacterium]